MHLHAIDCGSGSLLPLMTMPHCGAVVTRDQLDRVERLLARLRAEVGRRQQLLAEAGYASLAELRAGTDGPRLPWLVLMLDRWEGFVAAFEGYDYGRLIDSLMQLLREGPAVGLRAVVTGDRSVLLGQISTVFDDRLILRLADPSDYGLAGLPVKDLPTTLAPGRALSTGEHGMTESQIALLCDDPSGPAQVAALQALARSAPEITADPPMRVDALPMRVTAAQVLDLVPSFRPPSPLWALFGAGGDSLAPLGVDLLAHGPGAVVAGPPRSGRSTALLTATHSLLSQGTPTVLVTPRRSPLCTLVDTPGVLAVLDANGDLHEAVAGQDRYVVIVDDAELISADSPLGTALEQVLRSGRDGEHGMIIGGSTGDLTTAYRGFAAEARKGRTGLLLSVQSPADGDLFTVRLPRGAVGGPGARPAGDPGLGDPHPGRHHMKMPRTAELDLMPGVPVVRVLRTVYDSENRPLEVQESIVAADSHEFRYEVKMRWRHSPSAPACPSPASMPASASRPGSVWRSGTPQTARWTW